MSSRNGSSISELDQVRAGRDWALDATPAERHAVKVVTFLIKLLTVVTEDEKAICGITLRSADLHNHFPVFVQTLTRADSPFSKLGYGYKAASAYDNFQGSSGWTVSIDSSPDPWQTLQECMEEAKPLGICNSEDRLEKAARAFLGELSRRVSCTAS
jgi:hypothetical protein